MQKGNLWIGALKHLSLAACAAHTALQLTITLNR